jgi:hypothetical protein
MPPVDLDWARGIFSPLAQTTLNFPYFQNNSLLYYANIFPESNEFTGVRKPSSNMWTYLSVAQVLTFIALICRK